MLVATPLLTGDRRVRVEAFDPARSGLWVVQALGAGIMPQLRCQFTRRDSLFLTQVG